MDTLNAMLDCRKVASRKGAADSVAAKAAEAVAEGALSMHGHRRNLSTAIAVQKTSENSKADLEEIIWNYTGIPRNLK